MKKCTGCKLELPHESFRRKSATKDGFDYKCKKCRKKSDYEYWSKRPEKSRDIQLRHDYGIEPEEFNKMFEFQKEVCAICKKHVTELRRSKLCIDHDHQTNKVRGLLCFTCNTGIGLLGDNKEGVQRALDYLSQGGPYG